ncbi:hypothetical protein [Janthinobacterium sp. HLX7-2]|uniref:hypothetical protein n=1 Tax=Janthinobacterium sp. HLX7-2 TaxID=1259331 RepID=UPI003F233D7F
MESASVGVGVGVGRDNGVADSVGKVGSSLSKGSNAWLTGISGRYRILSVLRVFYPLNFIHAVTHFHSFSILLRTRTVQKKALQVSIITTASDHLTCLMRFYNLDEILPYGN